MNIVNSKEDLKALAVESETEGTVYNGDIRRL